MPRGSGNAFGLKRFEGNRPLSEQLTADRLNQILDFVDMGVIRFGRGLHGARTTGGTTINIRNVPENAVDDLGPFEIAWRTNPADPTGNTFQAKVSKNSDYLKSTKPNDSLSVTGLDSWFPFLTTDVITIFSPVTSYVPTSATVQSYGLGTTSFDPTSDPWNTGDNGIVFDDGGTPPVQQGLNVLLAYSTPDLKGKPYVIQSQLDHILIESGIIAGRAAVYDFSHRRRYGITAPGI